MAEPEPIAPRLARFAVDALQFVRSTSRDIATDVVLRQLARSASASSANFRSARLARSRQEFVARLAIALEEADESEHWLRIAQELEAGNGAARQALLSEAQELRAILSASLSTARRNLHETRKREARKTSGRS
jgi:four helix bundle protein